MVHLDTKRFSLLIFCYHPLLLMGLSIEINIRVQRINILKNKVKKIQGFWFVSSYEEDFNTKSPNFLIFCCSKDIYPFVSGLNQDFNIHYNLIDNIIYDNVLDIAS